MSRLECQKCKAVYGDVARIRECPLCGSSSFVNVEPLMDSVLPWRREGFTGNVGYFYIKIMRGDKAADINEY